MTTWCIFVVTQPCNRVVVHGDPNTLARTDAVPDRLALCKRVVFTTVNHDKVRCTTSGIRNREDAIRERYGMTVRRPPRLPRTAFERYVIVDGAQWRISLNGRRGG